MRKLLLSLLVLVGFTFAENVLVIDVEGMTCEMCPLAVKKAVSEVEGVKWVKTSLQNRIAVVVTEDNVKEDSVLRAISKAGNYKGKVIGKAKF
ncbi:mercuric ion binding protein [Hydrogenivirga caldilitoris]|uniref:Mercuric ion binding protein n=1 Tax=Hydrogenivirga caldilitoris TaxID=246264 RepID=A0A497XRC1_9AQUI|nr:heavy metal-associated domain-containing protein [Hydrogenivirga caldilitoris]RLJ70740.1 mercuric ion binding protein [Hydrogenivirga caldilitoris]